MSRSVVLDGEGRGWWVDVRAGSWFVECGLCVWRSARMSLEDLAFADWRVGALMREHGRVCAGVEGVPS